MVMAMGTSICNMVLGTNKPLLPGMCAVVEEYTRLHDSFARGTTTL